MAVVTRRTQKRLRRSDKKYMRQGRTLEVAHRPSATGTCRPLSRARQAAGLKPGPRAVAAALPTYQPATAVAAVATVTQAPAGAVVVECVQDAGRLRVHVVSEGYDTSWNVQFPRAIRQPGARYVVDALHPAASTASAATSAACSDAPALLRRSVQPAGTSRPHGLRLSEPCPVAEGRLRRAARPVASET
jgi:hypothetical protein